MRGGVWVYQTPQRIPARNLNHIDPPAFDKPWGICAARAAFLMHLSYVNCEASCPVSRDTRNSAYGLFNHLVLHPMRGKTEPPNNRS